MRLVEGDQIGLTTEVQVGAGCAGTSFVQLVPELAQHSFEIAPRKLRRQFLHSQLT